MKHSISQLINFSWKQDPVLRDLSLLGVIYKKFRDRFRRIFKPILAKIYLKRLERYPTLLLLLDQYSASKSAAIDFADSLALFEQVMNSSPNYLLELGPGTSTAVICLAISEIQKKNPSYKPIFIAVENQIDFIQYHQKLMPVELKPYVQMVYSTASLKSFDGYLTAQYDDIPIYPYDFVHVDGPDNHGMGVNIQSDIINIKNSLGKHCYIVFDGRETSSRFTRKYLNGFSFKRHKYTLNHIIFR